MRNTQIGLFSFTIVFNHSAILPWLNKLKDLKRDRMCPSCMCLGLQTVFDFTFLQSVGFESHLFCLIFSSFVIFWDRKLSLFTEGGSTKPPDTNYIQTRASQLSHHPSTILRPCLRFSWHSFILSNNIHLTSKKFGDSVFLLECH